MASPLMLAREFSRYLPSDAKVIAWEQGDDVTVNAETCGERFEWRIPPSIRMLSMDDIARIYKPTIDACLVASWTVS